MTIAAVPATPSTVAGFGEIVLPPAGEPTSRGSDYAFWSDLAHYRIAGETEIGICTVFAQDHPTIDGMERHLRTPEVLIPIDAPFILPLLRDGEPESSARAFRVGIGEAIVINEGVWHGACLPVGASQSSYFVIFRRGTPHEDVEKKPVAPLIIGA